MEVVQKMKKALRFLSCTALRVGVVGSAVASGRGPSGGVARESDHHANGVTGGYGDRTCDGSVTFAVSKEF